MFSFLLFHIGGSNMEQHWCQVGGQDGTKVKLTKRKMKRKNTQRYVLWIFTFFSSFLLPYWWIRYGTALVPSGLVRTKLNWQRGKSKTNKIRNYKIAGFNFFFLFGSMIFFLNFFILPYWWIQYGTALVPSGLVGTKLNWQRGKLSLFLENMNFWIWLFKFWSTIFVL